MNISSAAMLNMRLREHDITHWSKEQLVVKNDRGRNVFEKRGEETFVSPTKFQRLVLRVRAMLKKKDTWTHNHPVDRCTHLSANDMRFTLEYRNFIEARASHGDGEIKIMEIPANLSKEMRKKGQKLIDALEQKLNIGNCETVEEFYKKNRLMEKIIERNIPGIKFRTLKSKYYRNLFTFNEEPKSINEFLKGLLNLKKVKCII